MGANPVCREVADGDTGDTMENIGLKELDTSLVVLVSGGTFVLVLVVVGGGVGEVDEVVVGNRSGTVGWLVEELFLWWITERTYEKTKSVVGREG